MGAVRVSSEERQAGPVAEREAMRREAILMAARARFERYGFKKTTMDEIARDAGITKPTVYTYFKGKKEILTALIEWEASRILTTGLEQVGKGAGAVDQLQSMFLAVDEFLKEDTFLQGIVRRDPDILTPEVLMIAVDFEKKITDAVEEILKRGMEEGTIRKTDPRLMAYATVRLHEAFTFSAFFDLSGYDSEEINAFFIDMMKHAAAP